MGICIYCHRADPSCGFSKEHIIPEGFGKFKGNLTLSRTYEAVCHDCNQYFGRYLDLYLMRDTIEGVERYRFDIKPKGRLRRTRTSFAVADGEQASDDALEPVPASEGSEIVWMQKPQVGFYHPGQRKHVYFAKGEVPALWDLRAQGFQLEGSTIRFRTNTREDLDLLKEEMRQKNIGVREIEDGHNGNEFPEPRQVDVIGEFKIDRTISRGICKVVFNYLAHPDVAGKEFVLNDDFDGIRKYIRFGDGAMGDFFQTGRSPILYEERQYGKRLTSGHLITVDWRRSDVVGQLRLFNMLTYVVTLCRRYSGIIRSIASGHCFDPDTWEVSRLTVIDRNLLP